MARAMKGYTRIFFNEGVFETLRSRFASGEGPLQRPERGIFDEELEVDKHMFKEATKELKRKIENLPKEKRKNAALFYVETSGKFVASALKLPCEGIYVDNTSILVPTQTLRHLCFQYIRRGFGAIDIIVLDDVYDSGETALKIACALSNYFYEKGEIPVRITFAAALRRRQDLERVNYNFSTLDFNAIPRCRLLYGKRMHSMKYFKMPWER